MSKKCDLHYKLNYKLKLNITNLNKIKFPFYKIFFKEINSIIASCKANETRKETSDKTDKFKFVLSNVHFNLFELKFKNVLVYFSSSIIEKLIQVLKRILMFVLNYHN